MHEKMPTARLAELANFTMGQSPDSAHVNDDERGLPFLQGCAEFGDRHPSARVYCFPPLRIAKAGSTLISVRAPVGTMNRADLDYCIGRGLAAILAKGGVADDVFLTHAIEHNISYLHRRSQGSTFLAVGSADLKTMPVAAPDLPQQQRIAEVLSTVDEAIEQTKALIAKTQQIKAGLMHNLFTRGVTADGELRPPREEAPQRYKESPLGWIPKEWDCDHLSALTTRIVDGVHHTPTYVEHGVPFVTVKNLTSSRTIDFTDLNYISLRDHKEFIRRADPRLGDVLVTKDGTLGVSRLVEDWHPEFSIFVSVAMLRPIAARLRARMLHMFFDCGAYERQLGHLSAGTGLKHIHLEHFRRFVVPLPDGDEQDRIACIADSVEGKLTNEDVHLAKLHRFKAGLLKDLLTGRVPVAVETTTSNVPEVAANV